MGRIQRDLSWCPGARNTGQIGAWARPNRQGLYSSCPVSFRRSKQLVEERQRLHCSRLVVDGGIAGIGEISHTREGLLLQVQDGRVVELHLDSRSTLSKDIREEQHMVENMDVAL